LAPRVAILLPTDIALSDALLTLNVFYYLEKVTEVKHSKCSTFAYSAILRLFFNLNSAVFVGKGAKIFFPGRMVP